jgi:putative phosphoesterase
MTMRIAILSDSHDNIWKLDKAIHYLATADVVLHCGDLISPFMIIRLGQGLSGIQVHLVWGNNEGDKSLIAEVARQYENIHLHGEFADLELNGLRVAINHYPKIARALAMSDKYALICYGHDHKAHEEWIGHTLLLNPGELMGMMGKSTIAIYDSETKKVEFIEV